MIRPSPRVGLVVVNYRSGHLTDRLLAGCRAGVDEAVVVDCTPGEPGLSQLLSRHQVTVVDAGENLGYGRAANLGASHLASDVLLVANPDVEVGAGGVRQLAMAALGVGLVAPRFVDAAGSLQRSAHDREPRFVSTLVDLSVPAGWLAARARPGWHPTLLRAAQHEGPRSVLHVLGALAAIDRSAFEAVGGFDPSFFMYREETDLCRRLRQAGWEVRHLPSVEAVHTGGGSTPAGPSVLTRPEHLHSRYLFIRKHWGPAASALARAVGLLATGSSAVTGPDRRAWARAALWHLRRSS